MPGFPIRRDEPSLNSFPSPRFLERDWKTPQLHFLAVQGSFDFYNIYNIIVLKEDAKSQQRDLFILGWPFFLSFVFFFKKVLFNERLDERLVESKVRCSS